MSGDEPRRSGRATKGQHNKHSSDSPGPAPKQDKKGNKKSKKAAAEEASDAEDDAEEVIRCICGNDNPADKRAFIGCDACSAWQHNVCMGMPDDEDEVGEHYFCEQCRPEEHGETLEALERGEKIWETRNKLWNNDKKKGKNRKSKGGDDKSWLKRELRAPEETETKEATPAESRASSNKRKRSVKEETEEEEEEVRKPTEKPARSSRQDKKRKQESTALDPDTALVPLDELPDDRLKIAKALTTLVADDIKERVASETYKLPKDQSTAELGEHHALRIEYALHINHGGPKSAGYKSQIHTLYANLKRNKTLIQELLAGHLTADELSIMSSSDMASEELQKERAAMKAESDRQAVIDHRDEGPRFRRTHKGDEIVEAEGAASSSAPSARPVRHSVTEAEVADGPVTQTTPVEATSATKATFDVKKIWDQTATATARPLQPRRQSSLQQTPVDGTKVDADVDRLLADEEDYAPKELPDDIVWQGKIVVTIGDHEPTVNARWVAGRDITPTVPWSSLLADRLNIDGRLQIPKAEEYLCGLQWSKNSDVSVLALTPYDDADAFEKVFTYFKSKDRYAVVNKDKPSRLVKDLYIIPVDVGSKLPEHVEMLEHCTIEKPVKEKLLLATFVVARAPIESPQKNSTPQQAVFNGHPQLTAGPAASPVAAATPQSFSAPQNGAPHDQVHPNQIPLTPEQLRQVASEILGDLMYCPTAIQVLATPGITRDQVINMRKIFDEDVIMQTSLEAFATRLNMPPQAAPQAKQM